MSKTFGQLKAGDEVYIIEGSSLDIVEVESVEIALKRYVLFTAGYSKYTLPIDLSFFHNDDTGDIYCDIDDAMRKMQDICAKAFYDYQEASGALNKLETKKKHYENLGTI